MNRRWRRLLASGLIGAILSMMMGRGRKRRKIAGRSTFMAWMGPFFPPSLARCVKKDCGGRLYLCGGESDKMKTGLGKIDQTALFWVSARSWMKTGNRNDGA